MSLLVVTCDYNAERGTWDNINYGEELKPYNIGGIFQLFLKEESNGFSGYYKVHKTGETITYDGTGLTKKKVLKYFWDKAKSLGAVDLRLN
ncbi:DnaB-like helicase [Bacillus phage vB_BcgM]|nr:DnaB-like helicase [Bacillus phage vB_BcgM]